MVATLARNSRVTASSDARVPAPCAAAEAAAAVAVAGGSAPAVGAPLRVPHAHPPSAQATIHSAARADVKSRVESAVTRSSIQTSERPGRAHRECRGIAELRVDALVLGAEREVLELRLHSG